MDIDYFAPFRKVIRPGIIIQREFNTLHSNYMWLEKGYAMEVKISGESRTVINFIEPNNFLIPFKKKHAIIAITEVSVITFDRNTVMLALKQYPDFTELRRNFIFEYLSRLHTYRLGYGKLANQRYKEIKDVKPWVLQYVSPNHIASYLNISFEEYDRMIKMMR